MFSSKDPAGDIHKLTEHLKAQHKSGYIYRGQTKDYASLIPSVFRKKRIRTWNDFCICSEDGYAVFSSLEGAKHSLMEIFMRSYGRRFGKYLAQQYLAQSEVIDVSESVDVAAFFATMPHPDYQAPVDSRDTIGVIYRFDRSHFRIAREEGPLDRRLARAVDENAGPEAVEIYMQQETKEKWKPEELYFTSPDLVCNPERHFVSRNYSTFAGAVLYSEMKTAMLAKMPDISNDIENVERGNYGDVHTPLPFLRPIVQQGGIITPSYLWSCLVPEHSDGPISVVWGDHFMGVEDVYGKYGMQPFYFRHSGKPPRFTRNVLWPTVGEDLTFFTIGNTVAVSREELGIGQSTWHMADIVDVGYRGNIDVDFAENEDGPERDSSA
jgi:hypothetical protein